MAALCYLLALIATTVVNFRVDARMVNAVGFLLVFLGASGARQVDMGWARRGAAESRQLPLRIVVGERDRGAVDMRAS